MTEFPLTNPLKSTELEPVKEGVADSIFKESNLEICEINLDLISDLDIDHSVHPVKHICGGSKAAKICWDDFLANKLKKYNDDRNHPEKNGPSGLSPYLHFGHIRGG